MEQAAHILTRGRNRTTQGGVRWIGDLSLTRGRVHEVCGPARRTAAVWLAAQMSGPVIWISPAWEADRLNGEALACHVDPARVLFVAGQNMVDLLWTMEEGLRSGHVPLVVLECPDLPTMTHVRRLHLAAQGTQADGAGALGLLLTSGEGGAPGIETRWHLASDHGVEALPPAAEDGHGLSIAPHSPAPSWRLARRRARALPPQDWRVRAQVRSEGGSASRSGAGYLLSPLAGMRDAVAPLART